MIDPRLGGFVGAIWGWVFGRKIWVVGLSAAGFTRSLTRDSPAPFASAAGILRISCSCSSSTCLDLRRACSHASCEQVCKLGLDVATFADALCVQMPFGWDALFLGSCKLLVAWLCTYKQTHTHLRANACRCAEAWFCAGLATALALSRVPAVSNERMRAWGCLHARELGEIQQFPV